MKKGQGMPLNVIIIAVIVIIVLVVLIAIFTGRLGIFSKELGEKGQAPGFAQRGQQCFVTVDELSKEGKCGINCPDPNFVEGANLKSSTNWDTSRAAQAWCATGLKCCYIP